VGDIEEIGYTRRHVLTFLGGVVRVPCQSHLLALVFRAASYCRQDLYGKYGLRPGCRNACRRHSTGAQQPHQLQQLRAWGDRYACVQFVRLPIQAAGTCTYVGQQDDSQGVVPDVPLSRQYPPMLCACVGAYTCTS
jgi:hypothetical protein